MTSAPRRASELLPPAEQFGWVQFLGAAAVFLFLLQIATGILLSFYYQPAMEAAHESVVFVTSHVTFGWLVRSMHRWAAEGLVGLLVLHLAFVYFTHAYRHPRQWTWVVGVALLAMMLAFRFTGQILPYDQSGYFTAVTGSKLVGEIPLLGGLLQDLVYGGELVSEATLSRFYSAHLLLLPWIAFYLMMLHGGLVWRHGVAGGAADEAAAPASPARRRRTLHPDLSLLALAAAVFCLGVLVLLSGFAPTGMGDPVEQFDLVGKVAPEWYAAGLQGFLGLFPEDSRGLGYAGALLGWIVLFSWPFIESRLARWPARNLLDVAAGILVCGAVVATTILAYLE